ncbi:hypothetical protein ABEH87_13940 [Erwinia sp. Eh17-17]|uniref:hypothetical protein n=1 Tax=Erwinia sp. Eh17-17 TaxID=3080330 RepID=UPI003208054C
MSIRDLNTTEIAQVSGGMYPGDPSFGDAIESFLQLASIYSKAEKRYAGKDPHYIAAVDPRISKPLTKMIDQFGGSGFGTLLTWYKQFA